MTGKVLIQILKQAFLDTNFESYKKMYSILLDEVEPISSEYFILTLKFSLLLIQAYYRLESVEWIYVQFFYGTLMFSYSV